MATVVANVTTPTTAAIIEGETNYKTQNFIALTRTAVDRSESALLWALDVVRLHDEIGLQIPSHELSEALVFCFFTFNSASMPTFSTYLHHAMASQLVLPFHVLLSLTPRVFQTRISHPELFTMYLELTSIYIFRIKFTKNLLPSLDTLLSDNDDTLQSNKQARISISDFGTASVKFILTLVLRLLEAFMEDWRNANQQETAMDVDDSVDEKLKSQREQMRSVNCISAIDLVSRTMQKKKTLWLLRLARKSMSDQWNVVIQYLHSLEALPKDPTFTAPKGAIDSIANLMRSYQKGLCQDVKHHRFPVVEVLVESRTSSWSSGNCSELARAASWLPIDIFLEAAVVRRRVLTTSAAEGLADLVRSLQSLHDVQWHEIFLAVWIAALRLVQRDLDHMEGPVPNSESRLCILLAIVPLTASMLIDEEEKQPLTGSDGKGSNSNDEKERKVLGNRRAAFMSSLKILGQFEGLLSPPQHVATAVDQAGLSAAAYVAGAGFNGGNLTFEGLGGTDANSTVRSGANLRHLIVETCIARGLVDTSVYLWPGYIGVLGNSLSLSTPQASPWNAYMEGASLTGSIKNLLISAPAKRVVELEKAYQTAITGPEDERPAAASILCGASLTRGWNIQEHAVFLVLRLLSPPISTESRGNGQYLIPHAPVIHSVLLAISSDDVLHILLLYGKFPELFAAILPICEVFGSLSPTMSLSSGSKEEISVLNLFSLAFLVLHKILRFHTPPAEYRAAGMLEYLLMRYNMEIPSSKVAPEKTAGDAQPSKGSSIQYVTMDSFPKLKGWLLQYQSCISATLSDLAHNESLRQVVDRLISMMLKKTTKPGSLPTTPGGTGNADDSGGKPLLPPWDLLAAIPFVVDALLTACGHGKLSPRDLTTGLRDLVDFFPASLASIISYLEAEVTRGLWKPASMNGKDWPNPATTLLSVETEFKEMLTAVGVSIPKTVTGPTPGNLPVSLPLPLAALLSLTITFKVDKNSEIILSVAGPALQNIAGDISAVAALWVHKVRRWQDFIIFGAAQSAIKRDKNAAAQLLSCCFTVTLGFSGNTPCKLTAHGGVGALLGHGNRRSATTGRYALPPGIFYLRVIPILHDVMFLPSEILGLLVKSVRELGVNGNENGSSAVITKIGSRLRCLHPSLATTMFRISQASNLAASLLSISGGTALVQLLYAETLPTWFVAGKKQEDRPQAAKSGGSGLLEGYAVAYFAVLSGLFAWGTRESQLCSSSRKSSIASHLRFFASVLEGKVFLASDLTTWKAYVTAFLSLVVVCASHWISDVEVEVLRTIAMTLRTWHEHELAIFLLEAGGPAALGVAGEFVLGSL